VRRSCSSWPLENDYHLDADEVREILYEDGDIDLLWTPDQDGTEDDELMKTAGLGDLLRLEHWFD
jgi:hypothetical protein